MDDYTLKIILAVITIIGALLTGVVIPYLKTRKELDTEEKRTVVVSNVKFWVDMAVLAAEQLFKDIPKSGEAKKDYVIEFLATKGIVLTSEELNIMIEAAVKEMKMAEAALVS